MKFKIINSNFDHFYTEQKRTNKTMSTSADNKNGDYYRIPLRWSKAWIMEPGCSDMRATNNCSTSMRLSSCGIEEGLETILVFQCMCIIHCYLFL